MQRLKPFKKRMAVGELDAWPKKTKRLSKLFLQNNLNHLPVCESTLNLSLWLLLLFISLLIAYLLKWRMSSSKTVKVTATE